MPGIAARIWLTVRKGSYRSPQAESRAVAAGELDPLGLSNGATPEAPRNERNCGGGGNLPRVGSGWKAAILQLSLVALSRHNFCLLPERGGGNETPEFHDGSRRRGGVSALGRRAAEGDAGHRLSRQQHVARRLVCT